MKYFKNKSIPHLQSLQTFVARCSMNYPGEVFKNISRCSYNPNIDSIKLQRCNYPKQQVFYCSMYSDTDFASTSLTCVLETAWEHIEDLNTSRLYCTLSRWQNIRPLNLWILPFSKVSAEKNRDMKRVKETMDKFIREKGNYSEVNKSLEFMSEVFSEKKNKHIYYKISASFYNALLFFENFMSKNFDGLLYPSANTEEAGINLVLKKDLIDNRTLFGDVAIMYSIQRSPNNPKHLNVGPASNESRVAKNGSIHFTTIT
ncbi:MAG TPA: hypothetical protein VKB95_01055 [Chitinophagaceae bacterium]|nr:hypothetical protein [Chitinophagaceae bacterium]